MQSINPATGQVIKQYPEHHLWECQDILLRVDKAWKSWKSTSFSERAALTKRVGQALLAHQDQYAQLITQEMGKIIKTARAEVEKCAFICDYYADNAEAMLADEAIPLESGRSFVSFEPIGVVLGIMPWNFPFWQVCRYAVPALIAGNACVLKHASNVPGCALALEEVFRQAGFPEDIFRTLLIPGSQVEPLIGHEVIKGVALTGSEKAGSQVAAAAGRHLKKTVMELGGTDPFVVLEDADFDLCCTLAVKARMQNAGQTCIAAKRFIVLEKVAAAFEARHKQLVENLVVGDPLKEETNLGPLARADLREQLHQQVQDSIKMGARLVTGGKSLDGPGFYYTPTILAEVKKGMPVYDQETFGPVSALITVKDEEEAIAVANDSPYGLGGSIWTRDLKRGERLARRIESGTVVVNTMTKSDPRLPFGGVKRSGYGREMSHYGIKEFVNIKTIYIA
ncbi:MAG: NAD-dependent succinate-semialdehyde dehydrogenase [Deltaproteobacteria bacterium]|nr:NAD-dependent succinate-semialdehyde dehydrogenase [Deltaproteobacteria bacterium]MBW1951705.1 NAD-dependent succinate-semialdehyde dehydrogenase [Deltaproteobacteria bacterium]MBW1987576.1 NAD-dependent succinate-semialdehyde dehydrogenase [Deltaproteobacteria bacterium]MBW2134718.1 NAD-dependent succinate-semialdehyde dehydrogenase [Deltaproteobacteria bacterium]